MIREGEQSFSNPWPVFHAWAGDLLEGVAKTAEVSISMHSMGMGRWDCPSITDMTNVNTEDPFLMSVPESRRDRSRWDD